MSTHLQIRNHLDFKFDFLKYFYRQENENFGIFETG